MIGRGFPRVLCNRTETGPTCFPTPSASCSLLAELIDGLVQLAKTFYLRPAVRINFNKES
jgi:hypothetical protein